jgi:hypothetical protein
MPVYLVTRTDFEHHDDEEGRLQVLDVYSELDIANKAAKAKVRQIWRDADDPAGARRQTDLGLSDGDRYGAIVRLDENEYGSQRVWIRVEKRKLRTSLPRIEPEDEGEEQSDIEASQGEEATLDGRQEPENGNIEGVAVLADGA